MSYRTIVTVVNEHTISMVIARYAIALAAAGKTNLVLYAVDDDGSDQTVLQRSARHQDHLYSVASELGISVTRIREVGKIATLLPKRVVLEKADLVFYPLTPYKRFGADRQRLLLHTLLQSIRTDLAIMRVVTLARPHPGHILVPLGKNISGKEHRLLFISELASCFHAEITLLHLFAERDKPTMPDEIHQFRKLLEQRHISVHERSGQGQIGRAITVEAVTRQNDLVVLGASGRGVVRRLFFGNPAGDVMQQPPCNTILFQAAH
ncbi:MAG TPA: universal stress protein [Desulfuromonadales bacterium]|nr:universal stress protein [Desulfuromonadales bacterium]